MREKVEEALKEVRENLKKDGGDVELVEVTPEGVVKVRLKGACGSCPMAHITLQTRIEKVLKEKIPQVKSVQAVL